MGQRWCAQENLHRLPDANLVDVRQSLDVLNLDEHLPFLDVAHLVDVVVDVELCPQLRMDYYLDAVDAEQQMAQMRMDYYLHVEPALQPRPLVHSVLHALPLPLQPSRPYVTLSALAQL